jgi:hypothetical protein
LEKGTQAGRWSGLIASLLGRKWKCEERIKKEEKEVKLK